MSGYSIAWLLIILCTAGGLIGLALLSHRYSWNFTKVLMLAGLVAFFVRPAPVPGYDGHLAPAFVVMIFEALFQTDGAPAASVRILLLSVSVTLCLTALGRLFWSRYYDSARR